MRKGMSKRVTLQQKYKIQKRCKEYKRKLKKAGKKLGPNGGEWKSKKEASIPNDWPFKDQMLAEIERQKALEVEMAEKNKAARKIAAEKKKRDAAAGVVAKPVESSLPRGMGAPIPVPAATTNAILLDAYTKRVWREIKQVVEESDVILEILDARDPLGSRCLELEQWAHGKLLERQTKRAAGESEPAPKPIILVLNKTDLVPVSVSQAWLDFFTQHDSFPVVAFHSNRALDKPEMKGSVCSPKDVCAGADALLQIINGVYADSVAAAGEGGNPRPIKVGIIGYGNVGKSSVLNTLARTHAAGVGSVAGYTKELSRFKLSRGIYAIDSPAVPSKDEAPGPHIQLPLSNNRIKEDVASFMSHFDPENLSAVLQVPAFEDINDFLESLAKKVRMMKGAELNHVLAARTLLKDWNAGKILYFTAPPELDDEDDEEEGDAMEEDEEEVPAPKVNTKGMTKKAAAAAIAAAEAAAAEARAAKAAAKKQEQKKKTPTGIQAFFVNSNRRTLVDLKKAGSCAPESAFLVVEGNLFDQGEEDDEEDEDEDGEDEEGEDAEMDEEEEEEEEEEVPPPPPAKKGKAAAAAAAKQQPAPVAAPASAAKKGKAAAAAPAAVAAPAAAAAKSNGASRKRAAPVEESEEEEEAPAAPASKKRAAASQSNADKPVAKAAPAAKKAPAAASAKKKAAK